MDDAYWDVGRWDMFLWDTISTAEVADFANKGTVTTTNVYSGIATTDVIKGTSTTSP